MIPKNSGKNPLMIEQKHENKTISDIRVLLEHAVSTIKHLGCMSQILVDRMPKTDDTFANITCDILNFNQQNA